MKCNRRKTEFEGDLCSECGARLAGGCKPAVKWETQWWFVLLLGIAMVVISTVFFCSCEKSEWPDMILGNVIPEPPSNEKDISANSADKLEIKIHNISNEQYEGYIERCKEKGFIFEEELGDHHKGYNGEGYKLSLEYEIFGDNMSIWLESPMMELTQIKWPESVAGKLLPVPKTTKGSFSSERDDGFLVYIGDMTQADYDEYVTACSEKGFHIDCNKRQNSYSAKNSDGWQVSLSHRGNTMSIDIDSPEEENSTDFSVSPTIEATSEPVASPTLTPVSDNMDTNPKTDKKNNSSNLKSDFIKTMDRYEEFIDEYIKFMEKYTADPTDTSMLSDYKSYMDKYKKFNEEFNKIQKKDLSEDELVYYFEVQKRVLKKLENISQ